MFGAHRRVYDNTGRETGKSFLRRIFNVNQFSLARAIYVCTRARKTREGNILHTHMYIRT